MARQPDGDERLVLPPCPGGGKERVLIRDLVPYLGWKWWEVMRFCRRNHLLHYVSCGHAGPAVPYVTKWGAMRVIVWVRTKQAAFCEKGADFWVVREKARISTSRRKARLVEERKQEQRTLGNQCGIALAFSAAETEDEPRRG